MSTILFALDYTIRDLRVARGAELNFNYGGPHDLNVVLRPPTDEEQAIGHRIENTFCVATSRMEANKQNCDVFDRIASNQILTSEGKPMGVSLEYTGPGGSRIQLPTLSEFPEHFQSFMEGTRMELADYSQRTVSALRWRANKRGPHDPISSRGMRWSPDGAFWHPAPAHTSARLTCMGGLQVSATMRDEVLLLVQANKSEPLHHDLFREAFEQFTSNPRSALVIGMAAAELGVKNCIATLVPEAKWLAANLPSPPLVRILVEYLPKLPALCRINAKVQPPPLPVLDLIRKGVTIRNQLAHAGTADPSVDEVEEILRAVHDVLWLLDYYSGYAWAIAHVRQETKLQLGAV